MGACCATSHDDRRKYIPTQTNQTKKKYPMDGNHCSQAINNEQGQRNCINRSLDSSHNKDDFDNNSINPSSVRNEVSY